MCVKFHCVVRFIQFVLQLILDKALVFRPYVCNFLTIFLNASYMPKKTSFHSMNASYRSVESFHTNKMTETTNKQYSNAANDN